MPFFIFDYAVSNALRLGIHELYGTVYSYSFVDQLCILLEILLLYFSCDFHTQCLGATFRIKHENPCIYSL